jgi:lysozyme family protein
MVKLTDTWRKQYEHNFAEMVVHPARIAEAEKAAHNIAQNEARYGAVSIRTNGVPWFLIGCLHYREASLNFTKFLGDGEPLSRATINVPAHMGPFKTFEDGAVAALEHEGFHRVTDWSLGSILFHAEEYNGEGYHLYHRTILSPYVWAGSNIYTCGKYVGDGVFDPNEVDKQLGVAVLMSTLQRLGLAGVSIPEQRAA